MRILRIAKMLQNEDTLNEVLEEVKDDFETVDTFASVMKAGVTNNAEEVKDALNKLSGAFSNLRTVYGLLQSKKKEIDDQAYHTTKINIQKEGKKFVSAAADREASMKAQPYRRLRNIVEGYKDGCEKSISTLQSILKFLGIEHNQEPQE